MGRSQRVWTYVASITAMLGVALAWLTMPLAAVIIAITAFLLAWGVMSLLPLMPPAGRITTITLLSGTGAVAVTGWISTAELMGLAVVGMVAMTAPPTVSAIRALRSRRLSLPRAGAGAEPSRDEQSAGPGTVDAGRSISSAADLHWSRSWDPAVVTTLSDPELCRAWRVSYVALHRQTCRDHLGIASFRGAVLDELQNRYPRAIAQWINDGARAAGNPARYLSSTHQQGGNTATGSGGTAI